MSSRWAHLRPIEALKQSAEVGQITGAVTWGSCSYQEGTPDMFFYGIHGIEKLYALMGPGCESVARFQGKDADVVTGIWNDGRIGTYRGIRRGKSTFGSLVFGTSGIVQPEGSGGYEALCNEIGRFFKTGKAARERGRDHRYLRVYGGRR